MPDELRIVSYIVAVLAFFLGLGHFYYAFKKYDPNEEYHLEPTDLPLFLEVPFFITSIFSKHISPNTEKIIFKIFNIILGTFFITVAYIVIFF